MLWLLIKYYVVQMEDVYEITYDTCGQYWPTIHHYIFLSVTLMQTTMIGLFGLKSKPGASFATIPLLVLNIMFNEYCKVRFLPTFQCRPVQVRLMVVLNFFVSVTWYHTFVKSRKWKLFVLIMHFLLGTLSRSARRATTLMIKLRGRQKAAQIMPSRPIHRHGCVRQAAPRNLVRCNL